MRKIKLTHKNLMIFEAGYIYCIRHNLIYDKFEEILLSESFDVDNDSEYDNLCQDLRKYRRFKDYELVEMTEEEYELCIDKFGESKNN